MKSKHLVIDANGKNGEFKKLEDIKDFILVENLKIKNLNSVPFTDWSLINKFSNLRTLSLSNCLVDKKSFFESLSELEKISELIVDHNCFFQDSDKKIKTNIKFPSVKKFIFTLPEKNVPNFDLPGSNRIKQNFIHNYPSYSTAFNDLEEIEFRNYEAYTVEDEFFEEGNIYFGVNFYQLSRLKKLKNIQLTKTQDELYQNNSLVSKLFEFPNDKKLKINNMKIEELKKGLDKGEGLNINYNIEDQTNEQISRYQDQNNQIKTLKINFWAQFKDLTKSKEGFKDRFNSILKQPIQYLTVSHTYGFLRGENMYSDIFKPFKSWIDNWKNLKSIKFEFDEVFTEGYGDMDGAWGHWEYSTFANFVKELLTKYENLKIHIYHPLFPEMLGSDKEFEKYFRLFDLHQVLNSDKKFSGRFLIQDYDENQVDNVLLKYFKENVNSIVIIDDNCGYNNSKMFNNVELINKSDFEIGMPYINALTNIWPEKFGKEYSPMEYFLDMDNFFKFSSSSYGTNPYNHIYGKGDFEEPMIFVKKSYLDKSKKVLFGNIQHLYYYCIRQFDDKTESSPIFWKKNEKFQIPNSVKVNQLETLYLTNGRTVSFGDIAKLAGNKLKFLIIENMLTDDFSIPPMPKLEKMIIENEINGKITSKFVNLVNAPSLNELGLGFDYDTPSYLDLGDFKGTEKLKKLRIKHIHPKYTPQLAKLTSLEDLEISLWNERERVVEQNFEFIKSLKNLKKVKIGGGLHASIFINFANLMEFIQPNLEELDCDIVYKEDDHQVAYDCFKKISTRFKKLKKLKIEVSSCFSDTELRSGGVFNYKDYKIKYNEKTETYLNTVTKEKFKTGKSKNKSLFDFKIFKNLKYLESISFHGDYKLGYAVSNESAILEMQNLTRISMGKDLFSNDILKKIKKARDDFLDHYKKLKKYKSIKNEYGLDEKDKEKYDQLNIKFGPGWYGDSVETILEERQKKKKK